MSWKDLFSEEDFTNEEFNEIVSGVRYGESNRWIWVDDGIGNKRNNPNNPKKKKARTSFPAEDFTYFDDAVFDLDP